MHSPVEYSGGGGGGGGGAVSSVFGRTGAVTAANGDYTASQITNVPGGTITVTDVQSALNQLDTLKVPLAGHAASSLAGNATGSVGPLTDITLGAGLTFTGGQLALASTGGPYVLKVGDTMTGSLGIGVAPTARLDVGQTSRARLDVSGAAASWITTSLAGGAYAAQNYDALSFSNTLSGGVGTVLNATGFGIGLSPATRFDVAQVSRVRFDLSAAAAQITSVNAAGSAFAAISYDAASHSWTLSSGASNMSMPAGGGVLCGAATGGAQGLGTLNAAALYEQGVSLAAKYAQLAVANNFTAAQTINQGTIAAAVSAFTVASTWNNAAVNFTAEVVNVTNTASGASSKLVDWQV